MRKYYIRKGTERLADGSYGDKQASKKKSGGQHRKHKPEEPPHEPEGEVDMSVKTTSLIEQALAYAKFSDPDLEKATLQLVKQLGEDLFESGYEASSDMENTERALEDYLNTIDEARENLSAAIKDSDPEDLSDEDLEEQDAIGTAD